MTDKKNYFIDARHYIINHQIVDIKKITQDAEVIAPALTITVEQYIENEINQATLKFLRPLNQDPTIAAIELCEPDPIIREQRIREHLEALINCCK